MADTIILRKGFERLSKQEFKKFEKGDTIWGADSNAEEIKRWDAKDKEEAKKELAKYKCVYSKGIEIWDVEEYALEYCECDEDGEFIQGSDYDLAEEWEAE